jgi:maltooligosyltrehalose trehalohydrolase
VLRLRVALWAVPTGQATTLSGPLGVVPAEDGLVEFRVWAPRAGSVAVELADGTHDLENAGDGVYAARVEARPGNDYRFRLDGEEAWPDPCSRFQPEGVRGPSRVVDPAAFLWTDGGWNPPALDELALYELHVGVFTPEGTFDAALERFAELRELGVTAVELMPVATFPGNRGWGYDGLYTYAPHPAYGGPEGLVRLVDAAHANGLAVLLDVVYNHVGPGHEALAAFGPYFTDRYQTFWGAAMNYEAGGVRAWAIENAAMWVRDYHVDGLRLDATHTVFDESPTHVLAELAERVRAENPRALVISEVEPGDLRPLREWGHDAQWGDDLHHAVHVLLTGEQDGYYEPYGKVADVAVALAHPEARRFVVCAQNHDQVGNRALGDRLRGAKLRLAAFCAVLAPGVPLLFMGEEHDEARPFQFFTDHIDPAIAEATREGRKREFERFPAFAGEEVPDPQAEETFLRSKLDPEAGDTEHRAYYRELLELRRRLPDGPVEVEVDEEARVLTVRRGDTTLVVNFSDSTFEDVLPWTGVVRWPP